MSEEITFDDIEFGEPIEEREPNYRDGYIRGIYRAKNIIDSKQKEIERLNNIKQKAINELFDLKDMIYKPETREINFDIQRKISSIIKVLGKELKGSDEE